MTRDATAMTALPAVPPCIVDVAVKSELWVASGAERILRRVLEAAVTAQPAASGAELSIVLTDDAAIRRLNHQWRNIDKATNVLSFPAQREMPTPAARAVAAPDSPPLLLGDIVLAYETILREAAEAGMPFAHHLAHLGLHGFLHLMGYDHDSGAAADIMERLESDILASIAVPDPYRTHEADA